MTIIEFLLRLLAAILTIFGIHADGELHDDLSVTITIEAPQPATIEGCYQLGGPCDETPWPDYTPGETD